MKISLEKVFEYMADKYGYDFTVSQFNEEKRNKPNWPSMKSIIKSEGSWNKAKEKFGYQLNKQRWPKAKLKECMDEVAAMYGPAFTIDNFWEYGRNVNKKFPSPYVIVEYYGFNNFKRELGYETNNTGPNSNIKGVSKTAYCNDCLEQDDCNIELQHCEYYDYYRKEVANG